MVVAILGLEAMWDELVQLVNGQFESSAFKRLLAVRFSKERAKCYSMQMVHYVKNRRDCWGFVQGAAPLDVKKIIWVHEQEELMGDEQAGELDHIALAVKEGELLGLTAEDFEQAPPMDGAVACFYAWIHLAKDRPWLEALASAAILEMRNSEELVRGGSLSWRIGDKWERELGISLKAQINNAKHVEADVEHAHLLLDVARRHADTEQARQAILRGARESLTIDRVYRGHLAEALERLP